MSKNGFQNLFSNYIISSFTKFFKKVFKMYRPKKKSKCLSSQPLIKFISWTLVRNIETSICNSHLLFLDTFKTPVVHASLPTCAAALHLLVTTGTSLALISTCSGAARANSVTSCGGYGENIIDVHFQNFTLYRRLRTIKNKK